MNTTWRVASRKVITAEAAALLPVAWCVWGAGGQPASAATQTTLYASPTGSGSACSQSAPCSLAGAQAAVETMNSSMTGDNRGAADGRHVPAVQHLAVRAAGLGN